jgi:polar amino acid transport system substrate-binding protein
VRKTFLRYLATGTALAGVALAGAPSGQAATPLRLCADPANLPFSTSSEAAAKAGMPGLYIEIGQAVADALGRPMETVWSLSYFGKRNLRTTLLAGRCDLAVGLPAVDDFMGPAVIFSRPILSVGYAIVARKDANLSTIADLDGKRVAVQFGSPPQSLVAEHDDISTSTVMDPDEGMRLLAEGKVDAAFVWGPSAGYDNRTLLHDAYYVRPVDGAQMHYDAAIGFSSKSKEFRDQVDAALPALGGKIVALRTKYAMPDAPAVTLAAAEKTLEPAASDPNPNAAAGVQPVAASPGAEKSDAPKPSAAGAESTEVAEGREIFNGTCAHCHGPDAVQSERKINLRLLRHRYGEDMNDVFQTTVTKGRPAKGMPTWEGVFTEQDFGKIYAFLVTVQDP